MSGKVNRRTRRGQLYPQLEVGSGAGAVSLVDPMARAQFLLSALVERSALALTRAWKWVQDRTKAQRRTRKLRVCESAQLGEKRFVALIQADGQRFLIGGTSTSISLLATLPPRKSFRSLLPKDASFEVHE